MIENSRFLITSCTSDNLVLEYHKNGNTASSKIWDEEKQGYFGETKEWHSNGAIALEGNLVKNQLHGTCTYFNSNGNPIIIANYLYGKKTGKWVHLTEKKDTFKIEFYENGKLIREKKNKKVFR